MQKGTNLKPIWKGDLSETSKCRARICEDLNEKGNTEGSLIGNKYSTYLSNKVSWHHPKNPIQDDAVWVRKTEAVRVRNTETVFRELEWLQEHRGHGGQP